MEDKINDKIENIEFSADEEFEKPTITNVRYIDSENGVFANVWAIADTDSCGDPDCGCDGDS